MSETGLQAAARVLAATLTLLARETQRLSPPFSLWSEPLEAEQIKQTALKVAAGEAAVLWVDEAHPARGLAVVGVMPLESSILGAGSLRIYGPWLVEPEANDRRHCARTIATKAKKLVGTNGFLSIKTWQDPAIIMGFMDEGFQIAEIISRFVGPLDAKILPDFPFLYHFGLALKTPEVGRLEKWLDELGELFYDGHHRHGPYLAEDFSSRLWREVLLRDLKKGFPSVFLWDERQGRPVGMAIADQDQSSADLIILHITEDRRGEGLGRLLAFEIIRLLIEKGVTSLKTETASWNLPAISLYSGLGLKPKSPLVALHWKNQ
ncbi:MAG: GNAT family N-acetyltransferase [Deltaproteobacteria bacterium]|nr:GNAT family N-acetyltransferase [Deltaproteobacteria bacterium]